jgi:hypothetical protein
MNTHFVSISPVLYMHAAFVLYLIIYCPQCPVNTPVERGKTTQGPAPISYTCIVPLAAMHSISVCLSLIFLQSVGTAGLQT